MANKIAAYIKSGEKFAKFVRIGYIKTKQRILFCFIVI